ncbi:DUF1851 domain-containing protein [Amycolatopsis sp. OK19-0408]|uniref:DUF1851 domain-containing protein n=1 Tax=Amycolatopsis iheyensis TaxID=2945988 RepID=A0A9X2NIF9_9PSEU|nr:DUF1851 domain-containing protein [Amycolatopsis iheyensis]MCR6487295.1 DUF1851 domain-containing protein [Amycolatopsis iheyensis]
MSRFADAYEEGRRLGTGEASSFPEPVGAFLRQYHGREFGSGVYRVHDSASVAVFGSVLEMFPVWTGRVVPFGFDWLGRQFAFEPAAEQVLLFEPGTAEVLEIPGGFAAFHEEVLLDEPEAALAASFFEEWVTTAGKPPAWGSCAGYQVPLFLGGADTVANLEEIDLDVYWSLTAQIAQGVAGG